MLWEAAHAPLGGVAGRSRAAADRKGLQLSDTGKFADAAGAGTSLVFGSISDFTSSLEGKLGTPSPRVLPAMEEEHTRAADSEDDFTPGNYPVPTTPRHEWAVVTDSAARERANREAGGTGRRVLDPWQLPPEQATLCSRAGLQLPEVVALMSFALLWEESLAPL